MAQVVEQLGSQPEHVDVLDDMLREPSAAVQGTDVGAATLNLIRDLIAHFHETEPDISKSVLVFLPTYRSLEQQWSLLSATGLSLRLYVLHSSIDIEHSVKAIEIACQHKRKVGCSYAGRAQVQGFGHHIPFVLRLVLVSQGH